MKFCYLDESGTGSEPYAVMIGVIVDAYRMHITKSEWSKLLNILSGIVRRQIYEIHTRDFYHGNGVWRHIKGEDRAKIISLIFQWLGERKHEIVYTAVDKATFRSELSKKDSFANEVDSLWCFMALHISLAVQKHCQGQPGIKGHAVLIFDNEETEAGDFIELIRNPPEWTDTYYKRKSDQERLDQIVDVPYFGDSRHVALIQVADFVSFFLRKYIEIKMGALPRYEDEPERITGWAETILARSIPTPMIYMHRGRCKCADLFYRCAPSCLL